MIKIITGSLDSGKTTRLIKHYLENEKGDGFASLKIMDRPDVVGFDAMHLGSKERRRLLTHQNYVDKKADEPVIGLYHLNHEAYRWMIDKLKYLIDQGVRPIYIDEIGQLELKGEGFDPIIRTIIKHNIDLICTIRDKWLDAIIDHYQITAYDIIT